MTAADWTGPFRFIQLSDPQLGMTAMREQAEREAAGDAAEPSADPALDFAVESALLAKAVAEANRLRPEFVVVTGDIGNDRMHTAQIGEVLRITGELDTGIPIYWAPGNADLGNTPTPSLVDKYKNAFGADYHAFQHRGVSFLALNSPVIYDPSETPGAWEAQLAFVEAELAAAAARDSVHTIVFMHHPLFLETPGDPDGSMAVPMERRMVLLDLFRDHGVSAVFAGHLHRNNYTRDPVSGMLMVVTSAVGYQLGDDCSGYRVVYVHEDRIEHEYHALGAGPDAAGAGG